MRKFSSILIAVAMTLILGVAPSLGVLPANAFSGLYGFSGKVNESRLPACCRRNGAHRCNMATTTSSSPSTSSADNGFAVAAAPTACPFGPKSLASAVVTFAALLLLVLLGSGAQPEIFCISGVDAVRAAERQRGWPKRGPPQLQLV